MQPLSAAPHFPNTCQLSVAHSNQRARVSTFPQTRDWLRCFAARLHRFASSYTRIHDTHVYTSSYVTHVYTSYTYTRLGSRSTFAADCTKGRYWVLFFWGIFARKDLKCTHARLSALALSTLPFSPFILSHPVPSCLILSHPVSSCLNLYLIHFSLSLCKKSLPNALHTGGRVQ